MCLRLALRGVKWFISEAQHLWTNTPTQLASVVSLISSIYKECAAKSPSSHQGFVVLNSQHSTHTWLDRNMLCMNQDNWAFSEANSGCVSVSGGSLHPVDWYHSHGLA